MRFHFFAYISRMRYIGRWSLMRNALPENIQEHSHMVAVIAHALGTVDGTEGLNCLEGFLEHYAQGVRVFEADFRMTSDGYVVLRHDWTGGLQADIRTTAIPTREEFLATPILGKYFTALRALAKQRLPASSPMKWV